MVQTQIIKTLHVVCHRVHFLGHYYLLYISMIFRNPLVSCHLYCTLMIPVSFFFSHKDPETLINTVNTELRSIHEWICCNKLSLNVVKTQCMLFSNSILTLPRNVILNDTSIDLVDSTKFLGLFIDNKLSWKQHITY